LQTSANLKKRLRRLRLNVSAGISYPWIFAGAW
jgi:hypothetical protein